MTASYLIDPATRLGLVHYQTNNLKPQLVFYTKALGLKLHWNTGQQAGLGNGREDLLLLSEVPGTIRYQGSTGMYHFALLVPDRKELARVIARLYQMQIPNSPTDHVISKTTYLNDPDGNTIEIYTYSLSDGSFSYRDGTFDVRWANGRPSNGREPLDLKQLFSELTPEDSITEPLPETTSLGHVHLYGNNLSNQMGFYRDVLGFKEGGLGETIGMAEVALDRPHVIAFNTWQGKSAQPPPDNALGLKYFTIILPDPASLGRVLDRIQEHKISYESTGQGIWIKDPSGILINLSKEAQHG
jgi:catechol 2,3-dioxygenase